MKKSLLIILSLMLAIHVSAQEYELGSSLRMSVNTITAEDSIRINNYVQKQRKSRSLLVTAGLAVLSNLVNDASSIFITEIMKTGEIRSNQRAKWEEMIENECYYLDSLSYMNNLTDFYSKGSFDGPLDPANFNFNGLNLKSEYKGKDVLKFYCHVATDEAGLSQIFNHSKFNLVLDSMYFNPYNCHLPNMTANNIYPDTDKDYGRHLNFSFDERENLIVNLCFSFTSSWYNEAVMLAKDVDLGSFSIQIPINEDELVDSMFVYKRTTIETNRKNYELLKDQFDPLSPTYDSTLVMPDTTFLTISGDCFIVPRSYMPLPGGVAHWGTGEYNVDLYISEQCNISDEIRNNWHKDYKRISRMKKESKIGTYFVNLYRQNGESIVRTVLETVSGTAINSINFE